MFDPNADVAPINPLPQVAILLAVLIAVPEAVFQLGEAGLIGGPAGATWRILIAEKFAFSNAALFWMWETGQYPLEHLVRFVSYIFVHGNFLGALFSFVFVLALGKFVGERMSSLSVLIIYLGSGIGAAFLQALFTGPAHAILGASGASFGMIGALSWILFSQQRANGGTGASAFRLILQLGIFLAVMAYLFDASGWIECIAGFCVGFPLAAVLRPAEGVGFAHWFERMRQR